MGSDTLVVSSTVLPTMCEIGVLASWLVSICGIGESKHVACDWIGF
jgi:hypothetical protein